MFTTQHARCSPPGERGGDHLENTIRLVVPPAVGAEASGTDATAVGERERIP
jgi:hypothetical protein